MFLRNRTHQEVSLPRGRLTDDLAVAAVVCRTVYRASPEGLMPWEGERAAQDSDPPTTIRQPLWHGTSVTVGGHVRGPGRVPQAVRVELTVGAEKRAVLVWGDRQWLKNAGRLVASVPAPWERKPLSWALAFGGGCDLAPGPHPVSRLPHPGGRVAHGINPEGVGFYPDARAAEGAALPSIEDPAQLVRVWNDAPCPVGLAPCPDLPALRKPDVADVEQLAARSLDAHVRLAVRMFHHAPGTLIFPWLAAGIEVHLRGAQDQATSFCLPPPALRIERPGHKSAPEVPARIRSVHVSLDDSAVIIEQAHPFTYDPNRAPTWVAVENA